MKLTSETTTNEETFKYTLDLDDEGEITEATQIVDSVVSKVELVDTPTAIGEDSDTDVVLFTYDSATLAGAFGLQIRDEDGCLKAICDLDGETISGKTSFIVPDKVPAKIAEYAQAVCS